MAAIYDLADGRKLALYTENNRILVLTLPWRRGTVPGIRHNDCLCNLFSVMYHSRIYYVYENFSRQMVFGCLQDPAAFVVLSPLPAAPAFERPVLQEVAGHLYLFCQIGTEDGAYRLEMTDPWRPEDHVTIYRGGSGPLDCRWYIHEEEPLMAVYSGGVCQAVFAWSTQQGKYVRWNGQKDSENERGLEQQYTAVKEYCQSLEAKNKELIAARQALQEDIQEARVQLEAAKAGDQILRAQLEAAKTQYEELARTAKELQKIGKHWRDKYLGRPRAGDDQR